MGPLPYCPVPSPLEVSDVNKDLGPKVTATYDYVKNKSTRPKPEYFAL